MSKKQATQTEETKEIVERPSAEVGEAIDFSADAGAGLDYGQGDLAIPYMSVLQALSPQVNEEHGKYIEGAKPGMIFNTVTGQVFKGKVADKNDDGKPAGIVVLPCAYQKKFVEWTPRDSGGGFVASYDPTDPVVSTAKLNDKGKLVLPNGNLLVETAYHYVIVVHEDGGAEWAVISMSSSQLKVSRKWNTLTSNLKIKTSAGMRPAPLFSHLYKLTTVKEQKDQNTWFGWHVDPLEFVSDRSLYESAKKYNQAVTSGEAKAAVPTDEQTAGNGSSSDEVPF